jgi:hypothetical protein
MLLSSHMRCYISIIILETEYILRKDNLPLTPEHIPHQCIGDFLRDNLPFSLLLSFRQQFLERRAEELCVA